jgi:perosamine synthetase
MDPIEQVCRERGLALIEDAAEAHGAQYLSGRGGASPRWRLCGGFGLMSCFSFYANKLVTTGEGGMVLVDDETLAERLRSLRNLAFGRVRRFHHEALGFNFRMTNLQAALGVAQLASLAERIERKRRVARAYARLLGGIPWLELPIEESWARSVYWVYGVRIAEASGLDAFALAQRLSERGVETRPFFLGMHEQEMLRRRGLFAGERHPVAERLARQGLYLPSGAGLSDADLEAVAAAVRDALR